MMEAVTTEGEWTREPRHRWKNGVMCAKRDDDADTSDEPAGAVEPVQNGRLVEPMRSHVHQNALRAVPR